MMRPDDENTDELESSAGRLRAAAERCPDGTTLEVHTPAGIPLYDGDVEDADGLPAAVVELKEAIASADALLIATPEYSGSVPGVLKNTLDWVSRPDGDTPGGVAFKGRVAALMATSGGALGGLRGLDHVREILANVGVHVVPMQAAVGSCNTAFGDDGELTNERTASFFESMIDLLIKTCDGLKG